MSESSSAANNESTDGCSPRDKPVVILAEDSLPTAKLVMRMLNLITDLTIKHARNGSEAFQLARDHKHNTAFILMDVHMSGTDGLDATREIRFWESSKHGTKVHVPIIALTGSLSPSIQHECFEAGMNGFMTKPCEASDLKQLLKKYHLGYASL